ncbi:MAG: glycoside hydrolase family 127 protein [Sedimentisphaerales bacterium]|jgi:DUF1680 family protein|nr:glycoside hydrolase family 127 protein [Sedimentisphaerales bacterium]
MDCYLLPIVILLVSTVVQGPAPQQDYPVQAVPAESVILQDGFWSVRLKVNREVTIPHCLQQCQQTGRISNFEKAAGCAKGAFAGMHFNDSDLYKVMEGAAYVLRSGQDRMMRLYLDQLVRIIAAAQWDDGYLFTFYSVPQRQPDQRWTNIQWIHELYCMGHMYEAAVAHYQATGDRTFLDVAIRNADLVCKTFNPDGRTDPPGHQEIEIGLCKLYRVTGNRRYLDQARFFLEQRGRLGRRGPDGKAGLYGTYSQDQVPVLDQAEAVGHAVRAMYMYAAMADVAALTGDKAYVQALDRIWADVVGGKLYVTGGIGAAGGHEGFAGPYELPNMTAYCETCASIANILWNHRMFLTHLDARYVDVLERTLYNALLSGVSMGGDRFFYPNPLESRGQHQRSPWFECACCPSNIARFIPLVPGLFYAYGKGGLFINLFGAGKTSLNTPLGRLDLTQKTDYPWDGKVRIELDPAKEMDLTIHVRIPGWSRNEPVPSDLYRFADGVRSEPGIAVNGSPIDLKVTQGYITIRRRWRRGDWIDLDLPMPVRRISADPHVRADKGKVAIQRGPIVFCLEGIDNDGQVFDMYIPEDAEFAAVFRPELLGGVMVVTGQAKTTQRRLDGSIEAVGQRPFIAIPYYAWAHRGPCQMTVWPACTPEATRPRPAPTLAYTSKTTASFVHVSLDAIKDQVIPEGSSDSSNLQLDFWPHKGTTEWVQFEWGQQQSISKVQVYWFDDTGTGECRVPQSWQVLYRDADGRFKPVMAKGPYGTGKDRFNQVHFDPVQTDCIRIEIQLQPGWSAGIQEVVIE